MTNSIDTAMARSGCCSDALDKQDFDDQIKAIREALLIGLESFGEVERLTWRCDSLEAAGTKFSAELRPMHPTGTADTVGVFAGALRLLDTLGPECANPRDTDAYEIYETIKAIRRGLHIGLQSFGEVERIVDYCDSLRGFGDQFDKQLQPMHPTGAADTVGMFANALRLLDGLEPERLAA
jgi:hypothetical protein